MAASFLERNNDVVNVEENHTVLDPTRLVRYWLAAEVLQGRSEILLPKQWRFPEAIQGFSEAAESFLSSRGRLASS